LGRLVESCIGAHLVNSSFGTNISVAYWRERNHEVDFVLQQGKTTVAIEVKSGARRQSFPGMDAFVRLCSPSDNCSSADRALPWKNSFPKRRLTGFNETRPVFDRRLRWTDHQTGEDPPADPGSRPAAPAGGPKMPLKKW